MYMLSAICGSARSMDRAAQSVDFAYTTNHYTIAIPRGRRHILYGPIGNLYSPLQHTKQNHRPSASE